MNGLMFIIPIIKNLDEVIFVMLIFMGIRYLYLNDVFEG